MPTTPTKTLLFGGSFDPVHNGHLIAARAAAERLGLDRVVLVPAGKPPHKHPPVAPPRQRLEMLRLATDAEPMFSICDLEVNRQGPSYTLDTLTELRRQIGPDTHLAWLIGADMLEDLPAWHRVHEVLEAADIVVACRPPWDNKIAGVLDRLAESFNPLQIHRLRDSVVTVPLIEVSSTVIRQRIASGLPIRYMVPDAVDAYIKKYGVYCTRR